MCPSDRSPDDEPPEHARPPSDSVLTGGSYRSVMQRCAAGLAVLDIGGEFLEANPAFCDLTGYSHDALSYRQPQASDEAMYLAKKSGRNQVVHSHRLATPLPIPVAAADSTSGLVNLNWDASFASGNAFIDAEHRELFRHCNQLLDLTTRPGVKTQDAQVSLLRLVQSVEAHFQHEERILEQVGYPGLAGHAARHRALLDRARELCERANDSSILVADVLNIVIVETIHGHVVGEDRDYFLFLKGATAS